MLSLISVNVFGTAQIPDLIIYKGDTIALFNCPLNSFPNQDLIKPSSLFGSKGCFYTACWRNYIATWEVVNNELYLTEIRNACYPTKLRTVSASYKGNVAKDSIGNEYANLQMLFPQRYQNGKVKADWVDQKLYLPQGKLLYYFHDGFQSVYEREIEIIIEGGILIQSRDLDNSKTRKSKYVEDQSLLKEFIHSSIKRENLPESDSIERRVYVGIMSSDDNGKIDSVKVLRGVNELYDQEAIRIIKSIPEWEVIYRHGKKFHQAWTIPIKFDLTKE